MNNIIITMSTSNLKIDSKQVKASEIYANATDGKILKPQYQRKLQWVTRYNSKKKKPSFEKYIDFLYKTKHSLKPLEFANNMRITNDRVCKQYHVIDGNNRINAICNFMSKPLDVWRNKGEIKEALKNIEDILTEANTDDSVKKQIIGSLENIDYDSLYHFRRLSGLLAKFEVSDMPNFPMSVIDSLTIEIDNIRRCLCINKDGPIPCGHFGEIALFIVNYHEGGTTEEYNEIFQAMNKYESSLNANDYIAAILFNVKYDMDYINATNEERSEINLLVDIIRKYYNERDDGEQLTNDVEINRNNINAYDIITGLQNYCHSITYIIPNSNNNTSSFNIFFKIIKYIHNQESITAEMFESIDINSIHDFIKKMVHVANIIQKVENMLIVHKITHEHFKRLKERFKISENNLTQIIVQILKNIQDNVDEKQIVDNIAKILLFHCIVKHVNNDIKKKRKKIPDYMNDKESIIALLKEYNELEYQAGGKFVDNMCKRILNGNKNMYENITREKMHMALQLLMMVQNEPSEWGKNKKRRRQPLPILTMMVTVLSMSVPEHYIQNEFWKEHLIPFTTKYEGEIDLCRLGNLILLPGSSNSTRQNKHIVDYETIDSVYYNTVITKFCSVSDYDEIIKYENNKPNMIDNNKYNIMCDRNEQVLIDLTLNKLFH